MPKKKYYWRHHEKYLQMNKEWREKNRELKRMKDRLYNKLHREYRNYMDMIRRMKLKDIEGKFSLEEWENKKKEFYFTCPLCERKEPEIKLSIDHIIPITKGGNNYISNIQPLCGSCNSRKNNRIIEKVAV